VRVCSAQALKRAGGGVPIVSNYDRMVLFPPIFATLKGPNAMSDPLVTIFRHNLWANLRLLERCADLTDEQLDAASPGGFGSIRDTLEHLVTSEQSYFSRISTGRRYARPDDAPRLTLAEMRELASTTGAGLAEWSPKVQPGDTVEVDWEGTPRQVPKSIILAQVINHALEHRTQVAAILTQLGVEPPDLQPWEFFDQAGQ
jgi:uncharacterized damage-inducible protein DinB